MFKGRWLSILSAILSISLSVWGLEPVYFQTESGIKVPVGRNQVLVRYKNRGPAPKAIKTHGKIPELGVHIVSVPKDQTLESYIRQLKKDPAVEFAEPNAIVKAFYSPTDPKYTDFTQFWLLQSNNPNGLINIKEAWDLTTGNSSTIVAVLDTGVNTTHPDLDEQLTPQRARMLNDYDGDGDCLAPGEECAGTDVEDNLEGIWHGTHVAGIIAAEANGLYMVGVAPHCKIMPVKVLTGEGWGTYSAVAQGIIFAVNSGAKVINMSLGGFYKSDVEEEAVKYALERNVVVVAAAGNDAPCQVGYPAAHDGVIAVGSTNSMDFLSDFTCTGSKLHLVAPGESIIGLAPVIPTGGTTIGSGTSYASPIVAGVAALVRSLDSTIPARDVVRYIDFNADDLGSPNFDQTFGFGRVNAGRALQAAQARTPFYSNPADPGETFPYPNPFNPTEGFPVTFSIPEALGGENIKIEVFNLLGERIKTISGTNEWDGKSETGNYIGAGLYFYRVQTSKGSKKGKLTVFK